MARKKRASQAKRVRPKTLNTLAKEIRLGKQLDGRTATSLAVGQVRDRLEDDLDGTARALLLSSASHSATIAMMALKRAMSDTEQMLTGKGLCAQALGIYHRFDANMRAALTALSRLPKDGDEQPRDPENLGDLIVDFNPDAEPDVKINSKEEGAGEPQE